MSLVLSLLKELIARPSITPKDEGCQEILIERLKKFNFHIEKMKFAPIHK